MKKIKLFERLMKRCFYHSDEGIEWSTKPGHTLEDIFEMTEKEKKYLRKLFEK